MSKELKPCPFCGGMRTLTGVLEHAGLVYVVCSYCHASGPTASGLIEAHEKWQARAALSQPQAGEIPPPDPCFVCGDSAVSCARKYHRLQDVGNPAPATGDDVLPGEFTNAGDLIAALRADEREAFEAWMTREGWGGYCPMYEGFDASARTYAHPFAQDRWQVWQASAAHLREDQRSFVILVAGPAGHERFESFTASTLEDACELVHKQGFAWVADEDGNPIVRTSEPAAWHDVQAERVRQTTHEGWTPEHDDEHDDGSMAQAAGCYALAAAGYYTDASGQIESPESDWPWDEQWWKPTTPRRMLVKAGALILAEIERIDRAAMQRTAAPAQTDGCIVCGSNGNGCPHCTPGY